MSVWTKQFVLVNSMRTVERLAYWIVLLQMPVYIAQKDLPGGLHWEQATKGLIFFWWSLIQNLSPVLLGGIADKFGRKRVMFISNIVIIIGFLLISCFNTFLPFLLSTMLLGLGMGIFKPALEGEVSQNIDKKNSALGWGIYTTFVNIAYFLGPTCSVALKSISWDAIFIGAACVQSVNIILTLFVRNDREINKSANFRSIKIILYNTIKGLFQPQVIIFIIFVTGFTINHMQFYETMPNFVSDWSDTTSIAKYLPSYFLNETNRGTMIAFEWLYNINSTMLVLFVAIASIITRRRNLIRTTAFGIALASVGLFIAGFSMNGTLLIIGIFTLAVGEILVTPRISEYFSNLAGDNNRSQYLGYANLAWILGLSGGGLIGGYLYQYLGEKTSFAIAYLQKLGIPANHENAIALLCQHLNMNEIQVTNLLWYTYNPWHFWIPFVILGIVAAVGMFLFANRAKNL